MYLLYKVCKKDNSYKHYKELLKYNGEPAEIKEDNKECIIMAKPTKNLSRTKHIDLKYHLIRNKIKEKSFVLSYLPSEENVVDVFNKRLAKSLFLKHIVKLNLKLNNF